MPKNYLNIKQELIEGTWHGSIVSPWSHTLVLGFMSRQYKVHVPSNIKYQFFIFIFLIAFENTNKMD